MEKGKEIENIYIYIYIIYICMYNVVYMYEEGGRKKIKLKASKRIKIYKKEVELESKEQGRKREDLEDNEKME